LFGGPYGGRYASGLEKDIIENDPAVNNAELSNFKSSLSAFGAAFITDLLFIVILFLVWSYLESKKYNIKNTWFVWLYTFAFGIAGGLPLFLYWKERHRG
ncbi:MAG: DUF2834 domain-containing protein, partial [Bacteroidota bacterium]